jgi:flavodoxin
VSEQRTLVVYYSRSGTTRKIAEAISRELNCEVDEIIETKSRAGVFGYLRSVIEARRQRPSVIAPAKQDPSSYDLVIVGTPVWAWSVSSPVRAYLMATRGRLLEVAFFCTLGGAGADRAFAQMGAIAGKTPCALCAITTREMTSGRCRERVVDFARALEPSPSAEPALLRRA